MLKVMKSLFVRAASPAKRAQSRRGISLGVEAMEERRVMTTMTPVPVAPPETDYFVVTATPGSIQAGAALTVTVTEFAYATGKQVTSGGVTSAALNFSVGGTATALQNVTLANGTGKATLASLTKAETGNIFATSGAITTPKTYITGESGAVTVTPAATSQFLISAPASASAGAAFNITLTAEDKYGNIIPTYAATPTIVASDGQAVSITHVAWSGGVGIISIVLYAPDSLTLAINVPGDTLPKSTGTIVVTAASTTNAIWSGYESSPGAGTVTGVGGTWVEPTATGAGNSSVWVGIDGYGGSTVEQIGVATSVVNGATVYTPWIEFYGDQQASTGKLGPLYYQTSLPASFVVHPGDTISASVSLVAGTTKTFLFQMKDVPKSGAAVENYSSQQTMSYVTPQRSTVEWIAENPNKGVQPLANFGQVNITGAWATVSGVTGGINTQKNLLALNLSSSEGHDLTSNPPILVKTLGYNEPSGAGSSSFSITWTGGASGTGGTTKSNGTTTNGVAGRVLTTDLLASSFADMVFAMDRLDGPFADMMM